MSITGAFNCFPPRFLYVVLKDPLPSQLSPTLKSKYLPITRFVSSPRPACSVDQVKNIPGEEFDTGKSGVCRAAIQRASDRKADLLFLMTPDEPFSPAHLLARRGASVSLCRSKRSGRGCPLLRASNEHRFIVRVLRARRAPGYSLTGWGSFSASCYRASSHSLPFTSDHISCTIR